MNKLLKISEENLRRQQAEEEIRRIREKIYENNNKLENLTTSQNFIHTDNNMTHHISNNMYANKNNFCDEDYMQNQNIYNRNFDNINSNHTVYGKYMEMDRLMKKFNRIEKVKNPRDVLGYFQEEFHRLNIRDDYVKYNILIEKWPTEDVSNFYRLVDREHRNFESFCDFCVNRDDSLSEILSKVPQYDASTPFGVFLADATKFAESSKIDRIKFFCYYLSPPSLKTKIRENFNENYDIFKRRTQGIWNCQEDKMLSDPVNCDRTPRTNQIYSTNPRRYNNRFIGHTNNNFNKNNNNNGNFRPYRNHQIPDFYSHNNNNNNNWNYQQTSAKPNPFTNQGDLCYQHWRYGKEAYSCNRKDCKMNHLVANHQQQKSCNVAVMQTDLTNDKETKLYNEDNKNCIYKAIPVDNTENSFVNQKSSLTVSMKGTNENKIHESTMPTCSGNTDQINNNLENILKKINELVLDKSNVPVKQCSVLENKTETADIKNLPKNLLFALEKKSGVLLLIDSGSEVSILPKILTNGINQYFQPKSKTIKGLGNSTIYPIGSVDVDLSIGNMLLKKATFWVTKESGDYGIIGLDILKDNKLIISPHTSEILKYNLDRKARLYTAGELTTAAEGPCNKLKITSYQEKSDDKNNIKSILEEFKELTMEPDYNKPVKHGHSLEIKVKNLVPRMIKARKCNGMRRKIVEENFNDLIIRGAMSRGQEARYVSPITMVPKKDGNIRICIDYTTLNAHTNPISYPLPRIDELPEFIPNGSKIFSCLDLKEAYYSLPIHPNSQKYAAIIAHHGVFIPHRTTFGLMNAPMRFQMMMEDILTPCTGFVYVYLDDILVFSETKKDHESHLRKVLQTLQDSGLYLNAKKCIIAEEKVEFLGHSIGADGVGVMDSKVEAIINLPRPTNRKELKRFIGLVNYYFHHIPRLSEITAPLNELSGGPKATNKKPLKLNQSQINAYKDTLKVLAKAATLAYEDHNKPLILYSDASETHVGAVLEQEGINGNKRPLAFFSKKLPSLKRYRSTFYKELRALYLSLKHFQSRVIGRELIIRTDSQSVEKAITNPIKDQSPMEQRYIAAIKEFNPFVKHIAGVDNRVADILSRPPHSTSMHIALQDNDPDYAYNSNTDLNCSDTNDDLTENEEELITAESLNKLEIAQLQKNEPLLLKKAKELKKEIKYVGSEDLAVIQEGDNQRIILPSILRLTAFELAHGYLHLGVERSIIATAKDYWWPTLKTDIKYWCKSCAECQATKTFRHNRPKIGLYPKNTERFQFIHVDLIGPMNVISDGNKYIMTIKDRGTGFLVTSPLPNKKAETVKNALIQSWCGIFGVPQVIVTDNGCEFTNSLLKEAFQQLGIDHRYVPPYSPESNGFVERQHRSINVALRTLVDKEKWSMLLPLITTSINNSFIEGNLFTPSQLALGTCTNISGRIFFDKVSNNHKEIDTYETNFFLHTMSNAYRKHKCYTEKHTYYEPGLFDCEKVWIRKKNKSHLSAQYHGPYPILSYSDHSMIIEKNGKPIKVSLRNVKGYFPREELDAEGNKLGPTAAYNLRERNIELNYADIDTTTYDESD